MPATSAMCAPKVSIRLVGLSVAQIVQEDNMMLIVIVPRNVHAVLLVPTRQGQLHHAQSAWLDRQTVTKIAVLHALDAPVEGFLSMARTVLADYAARRHFRCLLDGTRAIRSLSLCPHHLQLVTAVPTF